MAINIYSDEEEGRKDFRSTMIEQATELHRHDKAVQLIANLLKKIEKFNCDPGFNNVETAYYAQEMALDFEDALENFLSNIGNLQHKDPGYSTHLELFKSKCENTINKNLEGVSHEPSVRNLFKSLINYFFKSSLIYEKNEYEKTALAKDRMFKDNLRSLKHLHVGHHKIEEIEDKNEAEEPINVKPKH